MPAPGNFNRPREASGSVSPSWPRAGQSRTQSSTSRDQISLRPFQGAISTSLHRASGRTLRPLRRSGGQVVPFRFGTLQQTSSQGRPAQHLRVSRARHRHQQRSHAHLLWWHPTLDDDAIVKHRCQFNHQAPGLRAQAPGTRRLEWPDSFTNESSLNAPFKMSTPARSAGQKTLPLARRSHTLASHARRYEAQPR